MCQCGVRQMYSILPGTLQLTIIGQLEGRSAVFIPPFLFFDHLSVRILGIIGKSFTVLNILGKNDLKLFLCDDTQLP